MAPLYVLVTSYALGCVVAAYYLARLLDGRDIRTLGSGNAGATNIGRSHGRAAAVTALVLDAAKAAAAVVLAHQILPNDWSAMLAVVGVIAGHVWPVQLGFRGGKGVASAIGGFLTADPVASLFVIGIWLVVFATTRRWALSGLVAIGTAPLVFIALRRPWPSILFAALAVIIVFLAHHPRADARRRAAFAENQT
jgi:acyl phosphate:glycerol-3-phosphate acyltransferase